MAGEVFDRAPTIIVYEVSQLLLPLGEGVELVAYSLR